MSLRSRLERLERDQPEPANGMPSSNFFELLPEVYISGTVDVADLSPVDRLWVEKFRGVFFPEEARNQECDPAETG